MPFQWEKGGGRMEEGREEGREEGEREREREREREPVTFSLVPRSLPHFNLRGSGLVHEAKQVLFFLFPQSLYCAISGVCIIIYVYGMLYILWFYVTWWQQNHTVIARINNLLFRRVQRLTLCYTCTFTQPSLCNCLTVFFFFLILKWYNSINGKVWALIS